MEVFSIGEGLDPLVVGDFADWPLRSLRYQSLVLIVHLRSSTRSRRGGPVRWAPSQIAALLQARPNSGHNRTRDDQRQADVRVQPMGGIHNLGPHRLGGRRLD